MKRLLARNNAPLPMPRFAERLQDGEHLLWEGRPSLHWFVWPKLSLGVLMLLILLPPLLYLESLRTGMPLVWLSFRTLFIGALVFLGMTVFLYQQLRTQAQAAAYAVSNRRIFIRKLERLTSQDWRLQIDEILLPAVRPRLRPLAVGFGTITLGLPGKMLSGIPEAAAVFAVLTEAKAAALRALPEAQPDNFVRPYYTPQAATLSPGPTWSLNETLRHSETILWEGKQEASHLWRAERWLVVLMIVFVSAWFGGFLWLNHWWTLFTQVSVLGVAAAVGYPLGWFGYAQTAQDRRYAVTNKRILVVKHVGKPRQTLQERELPETRKMRLKCGRDGIGTIIFEKKTRIVGQTVETYEFSFKHIANAEAVYGLIQAAQFGYRTVKPT